LQAEATRRILGTVAESVEPDPTSATNTKAATLPEERGRPIPKESALSNLKHHDKSKGEDLAVDDSEDLVFPEDDKVLDEDNIDRDELAKPSQDEGHPTVEEDPRPKS